MDTNTVPLSPAPLDDTADETTELYEHHHIVVDPGQTPDRLDRFLTLRLAGISRNKVQAAAKADCILVNGRPQRSSYKVKPSDTISVLLPTPVHETEILPEPIPLTFVYEDDDVAVVNKQAGLVVHPGVGNYTGTLLNGLAHYYQGRTGRDGKPISTFLVHRIDKDTTGLLLVAKTEEAQAALAKQFYEHTIERKYNALVWGDFDEERGTIDGNLGRSARDRRVMTVYDDPQMGKHAVTHWHVCERFGYVTLADCVLETGRTHQIRAHMRHIGHPLFNDATYGGDQILKGTTFSKYKQFVINCFKLLPRQALHAAVLGFEHPTTHEHLHFEAPLPDDMSAVLEKWRRYTVASREADWLRD